MLDVGRMAGLTLTRIEAVDARTIEHQLEFATMIDSGPVGHIGIGTLACTLSHAEAWRTFLADGAPWGVFLEDDVVLSDDFKDTVERLVQAPLPVDLVKIECGGAAMRGLLLGRALRVIRGRRLRICHQLATDAAGYLMSRHGAEQALAKIKACDVGVDHFLFYPLERKGSAGLPFAIVEPALVIQDRTHGSDIAASRHRGNARWRWFARAPYEAAPIPMMLGQLVMNGARFIKTPFAARAVSV